MAFALDLIDVLKISEQIINGMLLHPMQKLKMNALISQNGIDLFHSLSVSRRWKYAPKRVMKKPQDMMEAERRIFLPNLSIINKDTSTPASWNIPVYMVAIYGSIEDFAWNRIVLVYLNKMLPPLNCCNV